MTDSAIGVAGHGVTPIEAHAGAPSARGIATISNRLNVHLLFIRPISEPSQTPTPQAALGDTELLSRSVLQKPITYNDLNYISSTKTMLISFPSTRSLS